MRFLRVLMFIAAHIILSFGLAGFVYSNTYFVLTAPVTYSPGKPLEAHLKYKVDDKLKDRFKVRPKPSSGYVEVFNSKDWVSFTGDWSLMPSLNQKIEIKSNSLGPVYLDFSFEIQDTSTGKVYETNNIRIWNASIASKYIQKLNEFIFLP